VRRSRNAPPYKWLLDSQITMSFPPLRPSYRKECLEGSEFPSPSRPPACRKWLFLAAMPYDLPRERYGFFFLGFFVSFLRFCPFAISFSPLTNYH
jgi:hypothetical protein